MACKTLIKALMLALHTSLIQESAAISNLVLTSEPTLPPGPLCGGPVVFTCRGTEIPIILRWKLNTNTLISSYTFDSSHNYPRNVSATSPAPGSTRVAVEVSNTIVGRSTVDINSTLLVSNISALVGSSVHCEDGLGVRSNAIAITINSPAPPSPFIARCLLVSTLGGSQMTLQWLPPFNSQHSVDSYHVTVTPDPLSCSSNQVLPSKDYICSGLDPETDYSITVSAINCRNQEGESVNFNVQPQFRAPGPPLDIHVMPVFNRFGGLTQLTLQWAEPSGTSGRCLISEAAQYTLIMDSAGMMVERKVSSDSCDANGTCTVTFTQLNQICNINISASNSFGSSEVASAEINLPRLTSTNLALLVLGVLVLCTAIAGVCVVLIIMKMKAMAVPMLSVILLILGVVLSAVLWMSVGFHVGLQESTCNPAWQQTRDDLILSSFHVSLTSVLAVVLTAAAIFFVGGPKSDTGAALVAHASTSHKESSRVVYDEVLEPSRHHKSTKETGEMQLTANAAYRPTMGKESVKTAIYDDYEN